MSFKFCIITHVVHQKKGESYFAYEPYVREMNIWLKYVDEVVIVAPLHNSGITAIDFPYLHNRVDFKLVPSFNFIGFINSFLALLKLPIIFWRIFLVMKHADHIHLRCPGNMGLLACLVQILFPKKKKTAKYAGNWDPKAKQPLSYRLQKRILNNTFLTRNMQVLVYGEWEKISYNIKPFFTASYHENEKLPLKKLKLEEVINFIFVGTLSKGKNPLYAIQLVESLNKKGYKVLLNLYGEGSERQILEDYIKLNDLAKCIRLKGNRNKETIVEAYQNGHFVVLPSQSEGWPKAIAEGMFWGCIPIATMVSCVPFMLDYGKRGILLKKELKDDTEQFEKSITNLEWFNLTREKASVWSRNFTLDLFESEIKELIKK